MTATLAKSKIHQLIDDIQDEHTLGEAYLALQEVLHPESITDSYDGTNFETEIDERLNNSLKGDTLSNDEMNNWIDNLFKS